MLFQVQLTIQLHSKIDRIAFLFLIIAVYFEGYFFINKTVASCKDGIDSLFYIDLQMPKPAVCT